MALRDFTDSRGVEWQVWHVTATRMHPITRTEDYLRDFQEGWLCFESSEGKRRLAEFPAYWEEVDDEALERLCKLAHPSLIQRADETSGEFKRRERVIAGAERAERRSYRSSPPPGHPRRRSEDRAR
ncbi:MAG: hypothetical protein ACRENI_15175 [Gemmatimonadaceae bacterium]